MGAARSRERHESETHAASREPSVLDAFGPLHAPVDLARERAGIGGDDFGGGVDPKPHPSTVESARLEAEELATRRRVREETGVDVFAPFGSPPAMDADVARGAAGTPSRRRLHLRSPMGRSRSKKRLACRRNKRKPPTPRQFAANRVRFAADRNERLASDVARWRAEAGAVADQARESERSTRERELRRLEKGARRSRREKQSFSDGG